MRSIPDIIAILFPTDGLFVVHFKINK